MRNALAEMLGLNQAQIHRYEKGTAEPAMSALKRLALALGVTIEELVFEVGEREPDEGLRLQFEALSRFDEDEKRPPRKSSTVSFSNTKPGDGLPVR